MARYSNRDWDLLKRLRAKLSRVGDIVRNQVRRPPPDLAGGWDALWSGIKIAGTCASSTSMTGTSSCSFSPQRR